MSSAQLALTGIQVFDVGDELGRVYTPEPLAAAIVDAIEHRGQRPGVIVEPSVGGGAFMRQAQRRWADAHRVGVDLDPEARGFAHCDDTLNGNWIEVAEEWRRTLDRKIHHPFLAFRPNIIVGNPDFGRKNCRIPLAHAKACLSLDPDVCSLILPWAYACNATWSPFLAEHPPKYIRRITCRVWDVVREVAAYEWHRGFKGVTSTPTLAGYPLAGMPCVVDEDGEA